MNSSAYGRIGFGYWLLAIGYRLSAIGYSRAARAPVPQQLQERFRKPLFVGASPTRGSISNQDRGVTAASLPVKETVRVQLPAS